MDKLRAVFSFRGRTNRSRYWFTGLGIYAAMALLGALLDAWESLVTDVIVTLAILPVIVASVALMVRRLHDRNRSGWWVAGLYALPILSIRAMVLVDGKTGPEIALGWGLLVATVCVEFWAIVELGFIRGTVGANRFGEDPLQATVVAEVFS